MPKFNFNDGGTVVQYELAKILEEYGQIVRIYLSGNMFILVLRHPHQCSATQVIFVQVKNKYEKSINSTIMEKACYNCNFVTNSSLRTKSDGS